MNIGILTFHNVPTEGAILQAFALSRALQAALPHAQIEIVDHQYPSKLDMYGIDESERARTMDIFAKNHLPNSAQRFFSNTHDSTFAYVDKHLNGVVIGSDQVWKLKYRSKWYGLKKVQNSLMHPPFPNVYWPNTALKMPKIAYAPSVGQTDWTVIPSKHRRMMQQYLRDFALISYRDKRTLLFLEWIGNEFAGRAQHVPDPTFGHELLTYVDRASLQERLTKLGVDFNRPVLGIIARQHKHISTLISHFKEAGYQTVAITEKNLDCDLSLSESGFTPLEWAATMGFFTACVTERMHGAISCLLNNTPFTAIDFRHNKLNNETKLLDLLRSFELLDYHFSVRKDDPAKLAEISQRLLNAPWPSEKVLEVREDFATKSQNYISQIKQTFQKSS